MTVTTLAPNKIRALMCLSSVTAGRAASRGVFDVRLTKSQYDHHRPGQYLTGAMITRYFGSWNNALATLKEQRSLMPFTLRTQYLSGRRTELVVIIRSVVGDDELARAADYDAQRAAEHPSSQEIIQEFGVWSRAMASLDIMLAEEEATSVSNAALREHQKGEHELRNRQLAQGALRPQGSAQLKEERMIVVLQKFVSDTGQTDRGPYLQWRDEQPSPKPPTPQTIATHMGSWAYAIQHALGQPAASQTTVEEDLIRRSIAAVRAMAALMGEVTSNTYTWCREAADPTLEEIYSVFENWNQLLAGAGLTAPGDYKQSIPARPALIARALRDFAQQAQLTAATTPGDYHLWRLRSTNPRAVPSIQQIIDSRGQWPL